MAEEGIDRKTFLREWHKMLFGAWACAYESGEKDARATEKQIRPPGAVGWKEFMAKCNLCGKCWEACPHGSIKQSAPESLAARTPVIVPEKAPCYLCDPPICSQVCPEGAIVPVETEQIKIGIAEYNKATCLAYHGIDRSCDYCYDRCPLKDKAIGFDRGPLISEEFCVGCGVCEYFCVSSPKSIRIIAPGRLD